MCNKNILMIIIIMGNIYLKNAIKTQATVQILLAHFYKNGLEMYVSTNKQLINFQNYFGVLSGLRQVQA